MPTFLNDKYTLGRTLGQGASCKVRLAKDNLGNRFAAKIFKKDMDFNLDQILSTELKAMV